MSILPMALYYLYSIDCSSKCSPPHGSFHEVEIAFRGCHTEAHSYQRETMYLTSESNVPLSTRTPETHQLKLASSSSWKGNYKFPGPGYWAPSSGHPRSTNCKRHGVSSLPQYGPAANSKLQDSDRALNPTPNPEARAGTTYTSVQGQQVCRPSAAWPPFTN